MDAINAPVERIWELLTEPRRYSEWADAEQDGPAPAVVSTGDMITLRTRAMLRWWKVIFRIGKIEPMHSIEIEVTLPLGIVNHEVITLRPATAGGVLVAFN